MLITLVYTLDCNFSWIYRDRNPDMINPSHLFHFFVTRNKASNNKNN